VKYFRVNVYLTIKIFFKSLFYSISEKKKDDEINKILLKTSNKKKISLTSQCRISFLLILKFLKEKFTKKNEIIFCAYNLPEMANIASNLNLKIVFCDLNYETGFFDLTKLKKKLNKKTLAVVLTNMFNTYEQSKELKKICKKKKLFLIEDNAIYFDNYSLKNNKKIYSGTIGDFSIYSFNIMKNISALYGGAVTSNINDFHTCVENELLKYKKFNKKILLKQIFIFFILKIMSVKFLYRYIFFSLVKVIHLKNVNLFLKMFYPSLKFKVIKFPLFYFTNISKFSKTLIFNQLIKKKHRLDVHKNRKIKNIYYYNKFNKLNISEINIIKVTDFNYQNFLDFPLLVEDKAMLNNYLLKKGIESRSYHYRNCQKIFSKKNKILCLNSQKYENQILCLPNHNKISFEYMNYIINTISTFYLDRRKKKKIN